LIHDTTAPTPEPTTAGKGKGNSVSSEATTPAPPNGNGKGNVGGGGNTANGNGVGNANGNSPVQNIGPTIDCGLALCRKLVPKCNQHCLGVIECDGEQCGPHLHHGQICITTPYDNGNSDGEMAYRSPNQAFSSSYTVCDLPEAGTPAPGSSANGVGTSVWIRLSGNGWGWWLNEPSRQQTLLMIFKDDLSKLLGIPTGISIHKMTLGSLVVDSTVVASRESIAFRLSTSEDSAWLELTRREYASRFPDEQVVLLNASVDGTSISLRSAAPSLSPAPPPIVPTTVSGGSAEGPPISAFAAQNNTHNTSSNSSATETPSSRDSTCNTACIVAVSSVVAVLCVVCAATTVRCIIHHRSKKKVGPVIVSVKPQLTSVVFVNHNPRNPLEECQASDALAEVTVDKGQPDEDADSDVEDTTSF